MAASEVALVPPHSLRAATCLECGHVCAGLQAASRGVPAAIGHRFVHLEYRLPVGLQSDLHRHRQMRVGVAGQAVLCMLCLMLPCCHRCKPSRSREQCFSGEECCDGICPSLYFGGYERPHSSRSPVRAYPHPLAHLPSQPPPEPARLQTAAAWSLASLIARGMESEFAWRATLCRLRWRRP